MSHYYDPEIPYDVKIAALNDWVDALSGFSQDQIEGACSHYLRNSPSRRPAPADIVNRISTIPSTESPTDGLSTDQLRLLHEKILPAARRWVRDIPGLADEGQKTLDYWGEK